MLAYALAALGGAIAAPVASYSLFVLLCANFIGGAGCYALEYAKRVAFLERRRLAEVADVPCLADEPQAIVERLAAQLLKTAS